jgi:phage FluMu protein gp41
VFEGDLRDIQLCGRWRSLRRKDVVLVSSENGRGGRSQVRVISHVGDEELPLSEREVHKKRQSQRARMQDHTQVQEQKQRKQKERRAET